MNEQRILKLNQLIGERRRLALSVNIQDSLSDSVDYLTRFASAACVIESGIVTDESRAAAKLYLYSRNREIFHHVLSFGSHLVDRHDLLKTLETRESNLSSEDRYYISRALIQDGFDAETQIEIVKQLKVIRDSLGRNSSEVKDLEQRLGRR